MDPDEALGKARDYAHIIQKIGDTNTAFLTSEEISVLHDEMMEAARSLAEHFEALDEWIVAGGFIPSGWRSRP